MSDNKLLAENTIRRFMKLASVDKMTDNFIAEMGMKYNKDDKVPSETIVMDPMKITAKRPKPKPTNEETVTEEEEAGTEEEEVNEDVAALFEEEEEEDMELDMDDEPAMDAEPELGAADMSLTEEEAQLLIDLGKRLEEAMGGAMDEPADDMGDDMEAMDEPAMDDPDVDAPADEEEDEELMQEALVNEVLKRVTKRIVAAKLQNRK